MSPRLPITLTTKHNGAMFIPKTFLFNIPGAARPGAVLRQMWIIAFVLGTLGLQAQCISDDCGDVFADWALLSEETTVCEGATFEVANQTLMPDIDFYVWDWGNGERDTVYEVANHFYTYFFEETTACAAGNDFIVYNISLEIYRTCDEGQSCHTQIAPVAVRFKPRANFGIPPIVCAGDTIPLSDMSCNADEYRWLFSDGSTSTDPNPNHVFDTAGVHWVSLVVSNRCGTDTLSQPVEVLNKPVAAARITEESAVVGCAPLSVAFANESTFADDFNWVFPEEAGVVFIDTSTAQSPEPVVQLTNPGIYTVRLDANNQCGTTSWETTIEVLEPPQLNLFPLPPACDSATVALADFLNLSGHVDSLQWTVAGPEVVDLPAVADPVMQVRTPGIYTLYLEAQSSYCPNVQDSTVLLVQTPEDVQLMPPNVPAICDASDPVALSAIPAGGRWSGVGVDSSGRFDPAVAGVGIHQLLYVYEEGACALRDSLSLEVLEAPTLFTPDTLTVCETDAAVQLDFFPPGGSWSGPGIRDASGGLFDPVASGSGVFSLQYTVTDSNNCILNQYPEVRVQALPQLEVPDTTAFCVAETTIELGTVLGPHFDPPGGSLSWSGAGITDSLQGVFTHPGSAASYPVQLTYALDRCVVQRELLVDIIELEEVVTGLDRTVCMSEGTLRLTAQPAGGRWSGPGITDEVAGIVSLTTVGGGDFRYTYTLAGGTSCEASDELNLSIVAPDDLDAGVDQAYCADAGFQALPTPTPTGGTWSGPAINDAGVGMIDVAQLSADSTYWFQYAVTNAAAGCTFTDSVAVAVLPLPEAEINLPTYACTADTLRFTAETQQGVSYAWNVGPGLDFSGSVLEYVFLEPGVFPIELTAVSAQGCARRQQAEVRIATSPSPAFAPTVDEGCGPLEVSFTDGSAGTDLSYAWDLGNGETSTQAVPPAATYQAGIFDTTYQVRLLLSNACGTEEWVDTLTVRARPAANFGTQVDRGCGPLEIELANTTLGSADTYFWDFGNGQTATDSLPANPVFTTPDTTGTVYTISLIATNTCGADTIEREVLVEPTNVTAFFNTDMTQGCAPLTVNLTSYATFGANVNWYFGDGNTATGPVQQYTFDSAGVYTLAQYASNACGADTTTIDIEVLPAPLANFTHPITACVGQAVRFENLSGPFQTVLWDFGDGQSSAEISPEHLYDTAGVYTVELSITNSAFSCPATVSSLLTVLPQPRVTLAADALSGCPPLELCFTSQAEGATFLEWDFGDGNGSTSVNPCHVFSASGQYRVRLRGADAQGCFSPADTVQVTVFPEPAASFDAPASVYCGLPQEMLFANTSTGATAYSWQLGGEGTSNLTSPAVTYTEPGTYAVQLTAVNTFGCEDEASATFEVGPQPLADFAPLLSDNCAPQVVIFDNASVNADAFRWILAPDVISSEPNPVLSYDTAGSYDVTLIASYGDICFDSLRLAGVVNLLPRPLAAFSWELPTPAFQGAIQFWNESQDALSYAWDFGDSNFSEEENPLHDYGGSGSWWTELVATAANGCTDTVGVEVAPDPIRAIYFPNALSPETGEGDVRVFRPVGHGLVAWELEIFSPWGQRVFVSEELEGDQPAAFWDGSYRGKILPQGAYAYKATVEYVDGVRKIYTGSVTLLR
jgi:PKD repeat protein